MVFFPFSENQDKGHHFMFDLMPGQRLKKKKITAKLRTENNISSAKKSEPEKDMRTQDPQGFRESFG